MRRKQLLRVMVGILAIVAVILILGTGAQAQVKYKILHKFKGGADGGDPEDTLTFDASGNLYGTTAGTTYSTVFEMSPNPDGTWTETVLYTFNGENDPSSVRASVILDASGNMYGTSVGGGDYGNGTVWQLSPNSGGSWTETILHSFTDSSDGGWLVGGLIFDAAGNLYGAASHGGAYGYGVVYELTPNSDGTWTENELYSFTGGMDGAGPDHPNLVFDSAGNLYGVTVGGGEGTCSFIFWSQCGVVYELTPNGDGTWTESVLYRFTGGKDGGLPESTLTWDAGEIFTVQPWWVAPMATALFSSSHSVRAGFGPRRCCTISKVARMEPIPLAGWFSTQRGTCMVPLKPAAAAGRAPTGLAGQDAARFSS